MMQAQAMTTVSMRIGKRNEKSSWIHRSHSSALIVSSQSVTGSDCRRQQLRPRRLLQRH